MTKKVLIVAYYWPPSGGSGVQRWLKFVKYLPQFGWEPHVFTPENPSFAIKDESLLKDVPEDAEIIRFPIWEPYNAFFKVSQLFGKKREAKPTALVAGKSKSWFHNISTWVRGNLFIPDPRVFWVKPSVRYLQEYLAENSINTIITTGPPHSIHLIGLRLKKANPTLHWIADFRDPWSAWGLLDSLMVGKIARKLHRKLERDVLTSADHVVTITPFYARHFEKLSGRKIDLLTNGYDDHDFKDVQITPSKDFLIRHVGIVNEKCDPRPFMNAIAELLSANKDFAQHTKVEFIGEVHPEFMEFVQANESLQKIVSFRGNIPHKQLLQLYGSSSLLILVLAGYKDAEGYMPGKLFEYLATGLPILGVGPVNGDASALLKETRAGVMIEAHDAQQLKNALLQYFHKWKNHEVTSRPEGSEKYSRKTITGELVKLLN